MRLAFMARLRDQRGVAMVTVLMIAAALTAVASVAAFTTIKEFRASTQDQRSSKALAFAEAGVDRLMNYLKTGKINWRDIALAGCPAASPVRYAGETAHPPLTLPAGGQGSVGGGSYTVRLEVFNPITSTVANRFAPGACQDAAYPRAWESPRLKPGFWSGNAQYFVIISTGASAPSATPCPQLTGGACRTIMQVVRIKGTGLPVGIYAKTSAELSGNPSMHDISLITPGSVSGRSKVGFSGMDPYYFVGDFTDWASMSAATKALHVPAAIHAGGSIGLGGAIGSNLEHPSTNLFGAQTFLNCDANRTNGSADPQGTPGQSMWDQSGPGYGGTISGSCVWAPDAAHAHGSAFPPNVPPPTSVISNVRALAPQPDLTPEDYEALKATAQSDGMYCSIVGGTYTCKKKNLPWTMNGTVNSGDASAMANVFIAYFEFASYSSANLIRWQVPWSPCTDDPLTNKQVVIVVRRGNLDISGPGGIGAANQVIHGAAIVPDGTVSEEGRVEFEGTIIADRFTNRGASRFRLSECAVRNLPGPWIDVSPYRWSEVDR